jgi:hydrogenase expression/formation protein HypD
VERVFRIADADWRGIGMIERSGLVLSAEFSGFDACRRVPVEVRESVDLPPGCSCGEVMRGIISPADCQLFGGACTPVEPKGPCMVSSEGTCAASYRHGRS